MAKKEKSNKGYDALCKTAMEQEYGVTEAKVVSVDSIVVEPWVQMKCRFGCPRHEKSRTCPPFSPDYKETKRILECYKTAILVEGEPPAKNFTEMLVKLEHKATLDGYYKAFALDAGPCSLCKECNIDGKCRFPAKARPSMESCGIDVFKTVRNNGFEVEFLQHKKQYVKYFGLVLVE